MSKLLWRYLIYFGIFICFVQLSEYAANRWICLDVEAIGTYAPLFLSALLIDVTYRIGKRQNEIAELQITIQKQQIASQEYQLYHKLYKTVKTIKNIPSSLLIDLCIYLEDDFYYEYRLDYWKDKQQYLDQIQEDYNNCKIDLDLILGDVVLISQQYEHVLYMYRYLIKEMDELVKDRKLNLKHAERPNVSRMSEDEMREYILSRIPDENRSHIQRCIKNIQDASKINDDFFLEDIKQRYKRYNYTNTTK